MVNEAASQQKVPFIPQQLYKTPPPKKTQPQVVYQPRKRRRRRWTKKSTPAFAASFCEWVAFLLALKTQELMEIIGLLQDSSLRSEKNPHDIQHNWSIQRNSSNFSSLKECFFANFIPTRGVFSDLIWFLDSFNVESLKFVLLKLPAGKPPGALEHIESEDVFNF